MHSIRADIELMDVEVDENEQVASVCALVRRFAHEVLARQKQYRDDLLVSCLQFIISLPSECIDYDFADYLPGIQVNHSLIPKIWRGKCVSPPFLASLRYWVNLSAVG